MLPELLSPGILVAGLSSRLLSPTSHPCWRWPQQSHRAVLRESHAAPSARPHPLHPVSNKCLVSCVLPTPPCPPENGEMFREVLELGQLGHSRHTSATTALSTGSLAAAFPGKGLQSSLTGQHFICFAIRHHPALQLHHRLSLLSGANNLIQILSDLPSCYLLC